MQAASEFPNLPYPEVKRQMWNIVFDQYGNKTVLHGMTTRCYLCDRFMTTEKYRLFSKLSMAEIISVDPALFPTQQLITAHYLEDPPLDLASFQTSKSQQILFAAILLGSTNPYLHRPISGFEFMGYDLTDEFETSALMNCGGYFGDVIKENELTPYGLIYDIKDACRIQRELMERYPDEEHADCVKFAIWRKI